MWSNPQWQASQGQHWPMQQSGEVDWAVLAQQWIQAKEAHEKGEQVPDGAQPSEGGQNGAVASHFNPANMQYGWGPGWQQPVGGWPPAATEAKDGHPQTFDYAHGVQTFNHNHGQQPVAANFQLQSFDYNHQSMEGEGGGTGEVAPPGASQFTNFQQYGGPGEFNQYWSGEDSRGSQSDAVPSREYSSRDRRDRTPPVESLPLVLDAAKRKTLPAWIREGLEKMEKQKQKKIEKEKDQAERKARLEAQKKAEHDLINEARISKGLPPKSKYDSDDESDKETNKEDKTNHSDDESEKEENNHSSANSPSSRMKKSRFESPPPEAEPKSELEIQQEMVAKTRRLLTEVLLEVTNEEIQSVAEEVHKKARVRAPAKQLAQSSALASITGLGVAGYGSASSGEDSEDSDSDEELQQTIRQKQLEFSKKHPPAQDSGEDEEDHSPKRIRNDDENSRDSDEKNISSPSKSFLLGTDNYDKNSIPFLESSLKSPDIKKESGATGNSGKSRDRKHSRRKLDSDSDSRSRSSSSTGSSSSGSDSSSTSRSDSEETNYSRSKHRSRDRDYQYDRDRQKRRDHRDRSHRRRSRSRDRYRKRGSDRSRGHDRYRSDSEESTSRYRSSRKSRRHSSRYSRSRSRSPRRSSYRSHRGKSNSPSNRKKRKHKKEKRHSRSRSYDSRSPSIESENSSSRRKGKSQKTKKRSGSRSPKSSKGNKKRCSHSRESSFEKSRGSRSGKKSSRKHKSRSRSRWLSSFYLSFLGKINFTFCLRFKSPSADARLTIRTYVLFWRQNAISKLSLCMNRLNLHQSTC
ncbi:uncharacterized protein LOC100367024 [Saccoglossus kowalevskii]|uniref:Arginine/serine-rich protein PNISR-like n=1 Tax=Saccoglossus kowalevskii TaxID=10224 RepID=A0ABM0MM93_SACKO|nr:PREDICTED: arginine/serine-rich protein PNISR-like [Saccoglossus kowalevskii]